ILYDTYFRGYNVRVRRRLYYQRGSRGDLPMQSRYIRIDIRKGGVSYG
ncbi:hypothetical protein, partial [Bacillus phage SPG24]